MTDVPRRRGIPLGERPVDDTAPQPVQSTGARRKHCWVTPTLDPANAGEVEGLVLQWAQDPTQGWVALVVYSVPRPGGDITLQEWLPVARLRPAP